MMFIEEQIFIKKVLSESGRNRFALVLLQPGYDAQGPGFYHQEIALRG